MGFGSSSPFYRGALSRLPAWQRTTIIVLSVLVGIALAVAGVVAGMTAAFARSLPDVGAVYSPPNEATRIYASNGELIASLFKENRAFISLGEIPPSLQRAVIAVEDDRFYQHRGVDVRATVRAVWRNVRAREVVEGGSTITQQLARSLFLTQERVISRKLAEILLAFEIERRLTKPEILERYLNQVYFGQGGYGVELAARVYFGKHAKDLTLSESALIAGLIRAPSTTSPFHRFAVAKARQTVVLHRMVELGYISADQARFAEMQPLKLAAENNAGLVGIRAPYFVSYILPSLIKRYGEDTLYTNGLRVYTTLDIQMQIAAERAVREGVDYGLAQRLKTSQGALVAIDPRTGAIRAMIGGYDFAKSQFNRAWQAQRQPGSAFKPFIYTTAIANRMPPTKVIDDAPVTYEIPGLKTWEPQNYDNTYSGPVTMRTALERSINIPAIKTLDELSPARVVEYASRMGIKSPLNPYLSLALGTSEVTLLEMASAYGVFATLGVRAEPMSVTRITDRFGRVLEENFPRRELVLSQEVAYVMTDLLKGVILRGTGRAAAIGRPAAGKTGTTDDYRSAWFIGYTPYLTTAVWVGNDDNTPMRKVVGGTVPARIWASFMKVAVQGMPPDDWKKPEGVVVATVCGTSGLLASSDCPNPRPEVFIQGTEPTEFDLAAKPEDGGNGTTIPLAISSPASGARVASVINVEGTTLPQATVTLVIVLHGDTGNTKVLDTTVPVTAEGRFSYVFTPTVRVSGGQFIITVTAAAPSGGRAKTTVTVLEE